MMFDLSDIDEGWAFVLSFSMILMPVALSVWYCFTHRNKTNQDNR